MNDNEDNINNNSQADDTETTEGLVLEKSSIQEPSTKGWSNSLLRKVIRFIVLSFVFFVIVCSGIILCLPLVNLSFLNPYINAYVNKNTNLAFHMSGDLRIQLVPKFHLYVRNLSFTETDKSILKDPKNKNLKYVKKEHLHSFMYAVTKNNFKQKHGIFYKSKDLRLAMPIGRMLRADFTVDEISASKFKIGYNHYKASFSPLSIKNVDDKFNILANGAVNTAKTIIQAKFSSLSPKGISGDIHLAFNGMDLKLRIDNYALGKPLKAYVDLNANDLYDLVHLWGFHYHTKQWGIKGDVTLNIQDVSKDDIWKEIVRVNNNLTEVALKEKNQLNISKSVIDQEQANKPNAFAEYFENLHKKFNGVNKKIAVAQEKFNDDSSTNDQDDEDKIDPKMVKNFVIGTKKLELYYISKQGFKATGIIKDSAYDISGLTTHVVGDFTGYKGGSLHVDMLRAGGGYMPMIINADVKGNDFNEILGVVGYPYHSDKFNMKARVILRYGRSRRAGVYVDHIISDYTSSSHENATLTGNFFYGWYKGELYADAIVHNKENYAKSKIYIKKYADPLLFEVQGHGKTFSDILKMGNIPIKDSLSNWKLKTKIKIAQGQMLITPISLRAKLYHKYVNLSGNLTQNFGNKTFNSHINLISGGSRANALVDYKMKDDVKIKVHGSGKNIGDITKIFNFNVNSMQWNSDVELLLKAENNYESVLISRMDNHVKITKDVQFQTHGKAQLNYVNQHLVGKVKLDYNQIPINLNVENLNNKNIIKFSSRGKDLNKIYKLGDMKFNTKAWATSGSIILPYDWSNGTLILKNMKTHIKTNSDYILETLSDTKVHLKDLTTESNVKITSDENDFYARVIRDKNQSIIADIKGQGKSLRKIFSFINNANLDVKWKIQSNILWNPKHGKSLFIKKINLNVGSSDLNGDIVIDGSKVIKKTDLPDVLINLKSNNINLNDFTPTDKQKNTAKINQDSISAKAKAEALAKAKAKTKTKTKIFSRERFNLDGLKKLHIKGDVHVNNFKKGLMTITNADMYVTSLRGIITAKGKIYLNKGYADALVRLNTQSYYPQLKVVMNVKDMSLEEINKSVGVDAIIRGALINTKINLFTFGRSPYEMATHLNGIVLSTLGQGEIGSSLLNFANADLLTSPITMLTGGSKYKKLVCGAVKLKIHNGKVSGAPLLALKTKDVDIALSGKTNIGEENLNTRLIVYSRSGLGVSISNLTGGYSIKGPYNDIYFGKNFTDILAIGAKGTATWFTFGIYPLAEGLFKKTQNTANVCNLVMKNN